MFSSCCCSRASLTFAPPAHAPEGNNPQQRARSGFGNGTGTCDWRGGWEDRCLTDVVCVDQPVIVGIDLPAVVEVAVVIALEALAVAIVDGDEVIAIDGA